MKKTLTIILILYCSISFAQVKTVKVSGPGTDISGKLNIGDTTGKWLSDSYRRNDSVFYTKNSIEVFAYKIVVSTGSVGSADSLAHIAANNYALKSDSNTIFKSKYQFDTAQANNLAAIALRLNITNPRYTGVLTTPLTSGMIPYIGFGGQMKGSSTFVRDSATGNVGFGTASPLAPIHVGNNTTTVTDAQIIVSRFITGTSGNSHAFTDNSNVNKSGTIGYNSYDSRATFTGSNNYDHYASFQANPTYSSSGTMDRLYGLYTIATITQGTVNNHYGAYIERADTTGGGHIINDYGLYVHAPTAGINNYGIFSYGTAPNYLGGNLGVGKLWANSGYGEALDMVGGITVSKQLDANPIYLIAGFKQNQSTVLGSIRINGTGAEHMYLTNNTNGKAIQFVTTTEAGVTATRASINDMYLYSYVPINTAGTLTVSGVGNSSFVGKVNYTTHPAYTAADSLTIPDTKYVDSVFANVGANVASATAIVPTGNVFHVTGTTTITSITATNVKSGTRITIIFDGILTFTDGSNLKLAGNFTTSADATWTGIYDGTNWYETSRSTN